MYSTQRDIKVTYAARLVRSFLVAHFDDPVLGGYCYEASFLLARAIRKHQIHAKPVGGFWLEPYSPEGHYWVLLWAKTIVDVTATQFDRGKGAVPGVLIARPGEVWFDRYQQKFKCDRDWERNYGRSRFRRLYAEYDRFEASCRDRRVVSLPELRSDEARP
jgi:hypothetical protein